jgi:hypothetical protein
MEEKNNPLANTLLSPRGFEPLTFGFGGQKQSTASNCKTKTYEADEKHFAICLASLLQKHPELKQIITAWPDLPEHIKAAIKALAQIHSGEAG